MGGVPSYRRPFVPRTSTERSGAGRSGVLYTHDRVKGPMADPKESERHCSLYEAIHTVASGTRCCDCCPHLNLSRGGSCNPDPPEADLGGKTVLRPERQQGALIIIREATSGT